MDFRKSYKVVEATIPKTRALYFTNIALSICYLSYFGLTVNSAMIIFAMFFLMNCLGVTVTYHRFLSHRSFEFKNKLFQRICTTFALLSGSGSGIGWANIHRQHHRHSDKFDDPHQAEKGFLRIIGMDYKLEPGHRYIVDLLRDKFLVKTHQYYFLILFVYCVALFTAFGIHGVALGFVIPSAITMLSENATNFINHYEEEKYGPTNVWWMNFFSFGDGWHKNHHDNSKSYTTSNKWWQIDISGLVIKHLLAKKVII